MTIDKNRSLYTKWHFQCEKVQKRVLHKRRTWKGRMPETATPALLWKSLFKMLLAVFVLMVLLYAIIVKESCAYREPFLKDKWTNYEQHYFLLRCFSFAGGACSDLHRSFLTVRGSILNFFYESSSFSILQAVLWVAVGLSRTWVRQNSFQIWFSRNFVGENLI